jgi:hypothetical protein
MIMMRGRTYIGGNKDMRIFARTFVMLALIAGVCLPGTAKADFTLSSIGTYWSDPGGMISFNRFDTYLSGPATFSSTVGAGGAATIGYEGSFGSDGWSGVRISNILSRATGPAVTTLEWDYNFAGSFAGFPERFDINYFKDGKFVGHERYTIIAYQTYQGGFDMTQFTHAPIPPAGWLLGTGLIGLLGVRRKFTK